jgi:hypothetical protein
MADKTPVKAIFSGSDVTSLGEFASGDTIAASLLNGALPAISGAALTNLPADATKLPLAGGTLTGALNSVGITNTTGAADMATFVTTAGNRELILKSTAATGNNTIAGIRWQAKDSANNNTTFGGIATAVTDNTNGSEDGAVILQVTTAGTLTEKMRATTTGITVTGTAVATTDTDTTNTGSVTLDFAANQNFVLTLTGNVTLANPSTEQVGQSGFIAFIQDGTGSRTVSLGTDYETPAAAGLTLTSTASATDLVPYLVVASNRILLGTPQLAFA